MTVFGARTRVETPKGLIGPTFVGKRINFLGELVTVIEHSDTLCLLKFDDYVVTSITMQRVVARLPYIEREV